MSSASAVTYSPLRYPGGKVRLYKLLSKMIESRGLGDHTYVEPYAGGAGLALKLLLREDVWSIWINDLDPAIFLFWKNILEKPENMARRVTDCKLTIKNWRTQHAIYKGEIDSTEEEKAFATLFLNRTNRSGIICGGGVIGGIKQQGKWKIDARFNKSRLVQQIELIAEYKDRIRVTNWDALAVTSEVSSDSLCYLDPPYIRDGHTLYKNWYDESGHESIADFLTNWNNPNWMLTYDAEPLVKKLYKGFPIRQISLQHSANQHHLGSEYLVSHPNFSFTQKQISAWLS